MGSKRRLRRRQCTSKVRHPTKEGAIAACHIMAKRIRRRGGVLGTKFRAYRCAWCSGWHIGTNRNREHGVRRRNTRSSKK